MHTQARRTVRLSSRTRRTLRTAAISAEATLAVAACSSDGSDETTAVGTARRRHRRASHRRHAAPTADSGVFVGSEDDDPWTVTMPADGENSSWNGGWGVVKGDPLFGFVTAEAGNIYADPCQWEPVPPFGPTIDDLVAAWANVPGFDAAATKGITVDGYAGKQIEFTVRTTTRTNAGTECRSAPISPTGGPSPHSTSASTSNADGWTRRSCKWPNRDRRSAHQAEHGDLSETSSCRHRLNPHHRHRLRLRPGETDRLVPQTGRTRMNNQANRTVATSARTRRTVVSVAIAVIAAIPIAAGSSGASDETTSPDTTDQATTATTASAPSETPASSEVTATAPEPTIGTSIVGDVRLTFIVPDGWENKRLVRAQGGLRPDLRRGPRPCRQHLLRSLPVGGG